MDSSGLRTFVVTPGRLSFTQSKSPDTIIALDIALGGYRNVAPAKPVACLLGETGVFLDLAHLRRVPLDFFPVDVCNPHFISHIQHYLMSCAGINTVQL